MPAIETRALRKVYPAPAAPKRRGAGGMPGAPMAGAVASTPSGSWPRGEIVALKGLDLTVAEGEFFGLLGPNGAGKTTTIGILTTRVRPTSGTARVSGVDVATDAVRVRTHIGVVPQRPNPDRSLNALENLVYHAAYFGIARPIAEASAPQPLQRLDIADKATAKVDQLSGGQQHRL